MLGVVDDAAVVTCRRLRVDLTQGEVGAVLVLVDRNDEDKRRVLVVEESRIDDLLVLGHRVLCDEFELLARHCVRLTE